ncbi:hypothetical protein AAFF_G00343460 [Aldrovandia affinis]|uniref:Insulin-like growth factor-binding protein 6 n=1 Tax=Aldrovandia affinis TaxID=143900 RepID=A0AAD7SJX6_9TELE|nr:hypothetical protein AAFF_G00343460 [Aldrovandia affinis]
MTLDNGVFTLELSLTIFKSCCSPRLSQLSALSLLHSAAGNSRLPRASNCTWLRRRRGKKKNRELTHPQEETPAAVRWESSIRNQKNNKKMPLLSDLLALLALLLLSQSSPWTLAVRLGPHKACPSCRSPKDQAGEASTSTLALGEPCGVYTLSCARGLRCFPLPRESSPLQALLQGRGVCSRNSTTSTPERHLPTGLHPSFNGELEKGPCRKLQNAVLDGLEVTVFQSNPDIYIPNCDIRGFYRKKQCRSSKGMQRGHCWCVDEYGELMPSRTNEDGTVQCSSQ